MSDFKDKYFSFFNRSDRIRESINTSYDLIVIGGGITGAGIALDASLRGIKTLLVEKNDFASGTSSKSTKLIHGGLRYLKQLEISLVKESGLERAVAHDNIPHLVHPAKMLLPIVKNGSFNKLSASLAISVYDLLAKVKEEDKKESISRLEIIKQEPLLKNDILKSGILYTEYVSDDARLVIEVIKSTFRAGASVFNYMEMKELIYDQGKVSGIRCKDHTDDKMYLFQAKHFVSAAGPWVDGIRDKDHSKKGKTLHLTKGVHIVLPSEKLQISSAIYFDAFDGRMLFAIPRGKTTYVGTTDTNYDSDLDRVVCTKKDVQYILDKVNYMFDVPEITIADIQSSWAGLRPLIHEKGKSPSELSRKDGIFHSDTGLISIAGGKLTGFRMMAKRIVDLIQNEDDQLPQNECITENHPLHINSFENYEAYLEFKNQLEKDWQDYELGKYRAWYFATTYGANSKAIIEHACTLNNYSFDEALIKAEIEFVVNYESAFKPVDYFTRRSSRLFFDISSLELHFELILQTFSKLFDWSEEQEIDEQRLARMAIEDATSFN